MRKIKASVIIPVFNQINSLLVCLKFFAYQTLEPTSYEVIVVDDGSQDDLKNLDSCSKLFEQLPYTIKIIHQNNKGRAIARNTGVKYAEADCIVFCDGDRFPENDFLEKHILHHKKFKNTAVFGKPYDFFGDYNKLDIVNFDTIHKYSRTPQYYDKIIKLYKPNMYTESDIAWISFLVGNSSMMKDTFINVGGFSDDFKSWGFEHYDLALRLMNNNIQIMHDRTINNYHIPHKRPESFYKKSILESIKVLSNKHKDKSIGLLKDFLFGEISLQDFEKQYSKGEICTIEDQTPIYYTVLK